MNRRITQGGYLQNRANLRTTKDMTMRITTISSMSMTGWGLKKDTSPSISCSVFTLSEQVFHFRYLILDVLGQGTFGQVVKCQDMKNHEIVAVKVVKNKPAYFNQSMMEVTILELVCHLSRRLSTLLTKVFSSTISATLTMNTTFFVCGTHLSTAIIYASFLSCCRQICTS